MGGGNAMGNAPNSSPGQFTSNQFFGSSAYNTSPSSNMGDSYGNSSNQSWGSTSASPAGNTGSGYDNSSKQSWDSNPAPANQSWNSGGSSWNDSGSSSWNGGG